MPTDDEIRYRFFFHRKKKLVQAILSMARSGCLCIFRDSKHEILMPKMFMPNSLAIHFRISTTIKPFMAYSICINSILCRITWDGLTEFGFYGHLFFPLHRVYVYYEEICCSFFFFFSGCLWWLLMVVVACCYCFRCCFCHYCWIRHFCFAFCWTEAISLVLLH